MIGGQLVDVRKFSSTTDARLSPPRLTVYSPWWWLWWYIVSRRLHEARRSLPTRAAHAASCSLSRAPSNWNAMFLWVPEETAKRASIAARCWNFKRHQKINDSSTSNRDTTQNNTLRYAVVVFLPPRSYAGRRIYAVFYKELLRKENGMHELTTSEKSLRDRVTYLILLHTMLERNKQILAQDL